MVAQPDRRDRPVRGHGRGAGPGSATLPRRDSRRAHRHALRASQGPGHDQARVPGRLRPRGGSQGRGTGPRWPARGRGSGGARRRGAPDPVGRRRTGRSRCGGPGRSGGGAAPPARLTHRYRRSGPPARSARVAQQMDGVANTRSESCAPITTVTWSTAVSCADPTSPRAAASTPACGRCASGYRTAELVAPVVVTAPTCIPAVLRREASSAAAAGSPEPLRMSTMAGAPSNDPVLHPVVGAGVGVEVGVGFAVDCGDGPGVVDDDGDGVVDGALAGGCVLVDGALAGGCVLVDGALAGGCVVVDGALAGGCVVIDGALDGGSPVVEDDVAGGGTDGGPSAAGAGPAAGTRCTGTAGGGAGLAGGTDGGASAGGVGRLGAGVPA